MKTIFFDVDTQIDFLFPAGALAVPGAASIVGYLFALTRFAAANGIQILSTADAHSEDDPEFKLWKPHCVVETIGQRKISATLLANPVVLTPHPGALDAIADQIAGAVQIIIEKQNIDCFTNGNLWPLLDSLHADRYVVYGVVSEVCVQYAAFGLLQTGARVEVVTDAIKSLNAAKERDMLARFQAEGGALTTAAGVTG
ncbi:MAG: cysteine hydrolase [Acidobacteriota bacterium]|nr:cysteine hydrolase [Acidobacteriota bacterium]